MALASAAPFPFFPDLNGGALDGGKIYYGTAFQDPETHPITVYWDSSATQPAAQPIATLNGFPVRNGTPAAVYVNGDYSVTVRDRRGRIVYYCASAQTLDNSLALQAQITAFTTNIADVASAGNGAGMSGYGGPTLNYAASTVGAALNDAEWSLFWFPAVRAAVLAGTDCTAAVQAVVNLKVAAGGGSLYAPRAPAGGAWLFNGGVAQPDGYKNGILLPFSAVNADPRTGIKIRGEKGTTFKCGSNNMILVRISRNCSGLQDVVLDYNAKSSVILCGIVPEDMTQTTTLVSQSFITLDNVDRLGGAGCDGIVFQPGPRVGASDSGCFYHEIRGGYSNFPGGGRHVLSQKGTTWAVDGNRITRTNFVNQRLLRGNTGYQLEVGTEVTFDNCYEELIADGVTPNATPCARIIKAPCANIRFKDGYSEACTTSVSVPGPNIITSRGYSFTSASDVPTFLANVTSYEDYLRGNTPTLTPALQSTGGGATAGGTQTGFFWRQGKICFFKIDITNVGKGTLAAGNLSITGLPASANANMGTQWVTVQVWSGVTTSPAANTVLSAFVAAGGSTLNLRKSRNDGAGDTGLTVAELGATVSLSIQGFIITD
jgi:hypothetical protein